MKLSDAIRLGAMLRPQAFVDLFVVNPVTGELGSCALGAAAEAIGAVHADPEFFVAIAARVALGKAFPELRTLHACPVCEKGNDFVGVISECLNDTHRWTRVQIADWVQTIEDAQAPQATERTTSADCAVDPVPANVGR